MLGFDDSMVALMIALYMAQDSFGTATNVLETEHLRLSSINSQRSRKDIQLNRLA